MRCSTIITCELLNYTVQRQVNGQATEYTAIQSDADKQVMTDKLVRNSIKSKMMSVLHTIVCSSQYRLFMPQLTS